MSQANFDNATVVKKSNIYFDGKCISHTVYMADGTRKTIGVILPTDHPLLFSTAAPERMEIIAGSCSVRLQGESTFETYAEGQSFFVPGESSFEIQVVHPVDYVCHFEG